MDTKLKKEAVRLTLGEHGLISLELPRTDPVKDHVIFITTIAVLLKTEDKDFQDYIERRSNELFPETLNGEV